MITDEIFTHLKLFPTGSWAIWNENGLSHLEFFKNNLTKLKSNIIFLGLNRSGIARESFGVFQNFHSRGHRGDAELKCLIQDGNLSNLVGGYMTDLSEVFQTDSKKVQIDTIASGKKFEEQLGILRSNEFTVVCFGNDAFREMVSYYGAAVESDLGLDFIQIKGPFNLRIFRVYHYSLNGFNNKNVKEKLPIQLRAINDCLEPTNFTETPS